MKRSGKIDGPVVGLTIVIITALGFMFIMSSAGQE